MKDSEGALFLAINGNITPKLSNNKNFEIFLKTVLGTSLDCLYNLYKDDDCLLYVIFQRQNFMG